MQSLELVLPVLKTALFVQVAKELALLVILHSRSSKTTRVVATRKMKLLLVEFASRLIHVQMASLIQATTSANPAPKTARPVHPTRASALNVRHHSLIPKIQTLAHALLVNTKQI